LNEVLGWSSKPVPIPEDLLAITDLAIGSGGPGLNYFKWASLSFLIRFARAWKQLSASDRDTRLADAWAFQEFVDSISTEGGGTYAREALLHLVHPGTFERFFATSEKWRVVGTLKSLVDDPNAGVDRQLWQIRQKLALRFGPDFDFYVTDGVRALWRRFDDPLDEFVYWASRFHELDAYGPAERSYKLLTNWQAHDSFLKWCQGDQPQAAKLLRRLWGSDDEPLLRLGDFLAHLPKDAITGAGNRTTLGSFLLMGQDPFNYPPYRTAAMHAAYRLTQFVPDDEKDEVAMYRAALAFYDRLRERATKRGLDLVDRLDAQSVTWCITNWDVPTEWPAEDQAAFERYRQGLPETEEPPAAEVEPPLPGPRVDQEPEVDPLIALADDLLIDYRELDAVRELLEAKRQLIAYGPPGTGKTYVAQRLALAIAGDKSRVRLVQFHPSYAYEDFVEGYRPTIVNGTPAFELQPGPMKSLADRAIEDPAHTYILIVDELNRGNIAKIFGELYFLLEYRDEELLLQYSARPFRLPKNLSLIGTMNTADRSIALLDAALRRRFVFQPFFPDRPPIQGVLRRWLARHRSDMSYVADVVDAANKKLADRNSAIGPSYFMDVGLTDSRLKRVWQHEIMPLLEDYFFDAPERLQDFELDRLRSDINVRSLGNAEVISAGGDGAMGLATTEEGEDETPQPA
jgi:MoxR-like ATPase